MFRCRCLDDVTIPFHPPSAFSVLVTEKKMYLVNSISLLKLNNKVIFRESLLSYSKASVRTSEFHIDILKMPNVNERGTRFSD